MTDQWTTDDGASIATARRPTTDDILEEFEAERWPDLTGFARSWRCSARACAVRDLLGLRAAWPPQVYRPAFLAVALLLTFVVFGRARRRPRRRLGRRRCWPSWRSATRSSPRMRSCAAPRSRDARHHLRHA